MAVHCEKTVSIIRSPRRDHWNTQIALVSGITAVEFASNRGGLGLRGECRWGVEFLVDEGSSQAAVGVTADAVVSVEPGYDLLAGSFIVGSTDR